MQNGERGVVNVEVGQVGAFPGYVLRPSSPLLRSLPLPLFQSDGILRERMLGSRSRRKIEEDQQEQTRDLEHDCTALLTKGERRVIEGGVGRGVEGCVRKREKETGRRRE